MEQFTRRDNRSLPPVQREAARVLLVNADNRVLLLQGWDPANVAAGGWWHTPGGGLDPGESSQAAAARELAEETGLQLTPAALGNPVFERDVEFSFENRDYRQHEVFFHARVAAWEVDVRGHTAVERRSLGEARWWSLAELRATTDVVHPAELVRILHDLGVSG